jgi:glutathione synthase/RimK-type ligase-like ATP-grasp enzyme
LFVRQSYPYDAQVVALAKQFQAQGKRVIDQNIAQGDLGLGKFDMYQKLQRGEFPIPKTEFFHNAPRPPLKIRGGEGVILKWNYGFGGRGTFFVKGKSQSSAILKKYPKEELLLQEFISADYEYKVITVGFKALPVILRLKIRDSGFKPDLNKCEMISLLNLPSGQPHPIPPRYWGGKKGEVTGFKDYQQSPALQKQIKEKIITLAEQSSRVLSRELAKVDILQAGDRLYILEVNRWPGLSFFEKKTGFNVAREFVKYLQKG